MYSSYSDYFSSKFLTPDMGGRIDEVDSGIDDPPQFRIDSFQSSTKGLYSESDKEVKMWQNDWYLLYHLQNEHRLDLIREADLGRLLPTSSVYVPRRPALYKRLFYWIGRLLVELGTNLIERFEPVPSDLSTGTTVV